MICLMYERTLCGQVNLFYFITPFKLLLTLSFSAITYVIFVLYHSGPSQHIFQGLTPNANSKRVLIRNSRKKLFLNR